MKEYAKCIGILALVVVALCPRASRAVTSDALEEAGLSFPGYLEVGVSYTDGGEEDTTDVALAELDIGLEYSPNDWLSASVLLIYEDGEDGVNVDEAYASIGGSEAVPVVFTVGRLYLPVGEYSSRFCSGVFCTDPLTQSLSESQEDVVQAAYDFGLGSVTAGVANGDADEIGADDTIDLYYAVVELQPVDGLAVGLGYVSQLADSDELSGMVPEDGVTDSVAGLSLYVIYERGAFYAQAGYVMALDAFAAADLDTDEDGSGDEPKAFNVEVGYEVVTDLQLGARYGMSKEFGDFAEDQYGVAVNYSVFEGAVVGLEYLHSEYAADGDEDMVAGRFTLEF